MQSKLLVQSALLLQSALLVHNAIYVQIALFDISKDDISKEGVRFFAGTRSGAF